MSAGPDVAPPLRLTTLLDDLDALGSLLGRRLSAGDPLDAYLSLPEPGRWRQAARALRRLLAARQAR